MKQVRLSAWEDFETEVSRLFHELDEKRKQSQRHVSYPYFRGQADASWDLKTTLERYTRKAYTRQEYYDLMLYIKPTIESFTGTKWNIQASFEENISSIHTPQAPPGYEFMIYLRHHRFPSPLLDWTRSPYVAAFFAFSPKELSDVSDVSVYSFVEYYGSGKGGITSKPRIVSCGPYVVTHGRHYRQQSVYTICERHNGEEYVYCNHEEVLCDNDPDQDLITKYILPRSERDKAMSKLQLMNITSYSLFGNEESLMETLAYQELERGGT